MCISGSLFLAFSAPILLIAFLAVAHIIISGEDVFEKYVISILSFVLYMPELVFK